MKKKKIQLWNCIWESIQPEWNELRADRIDLFVVNAAYKFGDMKKKTSHGDVSLQSVHSGVQVNVPGEFP